MFRGFIDLIENSESSESSDSLDSFDRFVCFRVLRACSKVETLRPCSASRNFCFVMNNYRSRRGCLSQNGQFLNIGYLVVGQKVDELA